jgi:hypothetical protein
VYTGGPDLYANCPRCPLVKWCHSERDRNGNQALAKLADGHYTIGSLIQKVHTVSARTFEADYLCLGPRPDGLWFPEFDARHITEKAAYDPRLPVHLSIDSGVFTGAVAFQTLQGAYPLVSVFAEWLGEGHSARSAAVGIMATLGGRTGSKFRTSTDSAGGHRNPIGPTVVAEYEAAGLRQIERWPVGSVADSLATLEALIAPADGVPRLIVHPSCKRLISALQNYRRAKRGGQWQDYPEDPQHPHEDLVDALRGGLRVEFPMGLKAPVVHERTVPASRIIY